MKRRGCPLKWVSICLTFGVVLSLMLVIVGLLLGTIQKDGVMPTQIEPGNLLREIAEINPYAIVTLGVAVLLLTPLLQVIVAGVSFILNRERRFVIVASVLFLVVALSVVLTFIR